MPNKVAYRVLCGHQAVRKVLILAVAADNRGRQRDQRGLARQLLLAGLGLGPFLLRPLERGLRHTAERPHARIAQIDAPQLPDMRKRGDLVPRDLDRQMVLQHRPRGPVPTLRKLVPPRQNVVQNR